jgi:hypothetical protein
MQSETVGCTFLWNPLRSVADSLGNDIIPAYSTTPIIEVFPRDQSRTAELRRIREVFRNGPVLGRLKRTRRPESVRFSCAIYSMTRNVDAIRRLFQVRSGARPDRQPAAAARHLSGLPGALTSTFHEALLSRIRHRRPL